MSKTILAYFSPRTRAQTSGTGEQAAGVDNVRHVNDAAEPQRKSSRKRRSPSGEVEDRPRKFVRRFKHVEIAIKSANSTVDTQPENNSLPTPPESVTARPQRRPRVSNSPKQAVPTRSRRAKQINYAESSPPSDSGEGDDAAEEFDEYLSEGNQDEDNYDEDVESAEELILESERSSAEEESDVGMDVDMDAEVVSKPAKRNQSKRVKIPRDGTDHKGLDLNRPPLSDLNSIFTEITSRALSEGLGNTLEILDGRELRVATMCSGTESPLLALQLVSEALKRLGISTPLRLRHLFSAEIVPIKQAFIERNYSPPIIFRDVRELVEPQAQTQGATNVYGAKVQVPGDVDLLVAGFSCVDYSNLNQKKKAAGEKGESKDTFEAICAYTRAWKPKIIVLENLYSAPWSYIKSCMKDAGYVTEFTRVDTKDYYLPQTRARGYAVCLLKEAHPRAAAAVDRWVDLMDWFKRRASAPASAFLLPTDDERVYQYNAELARQIRDTARDRTVQWDACRLRHEKVRNKEELGDKRPITEWVDGGTCVSFEHAHKLWLSKQVERVWDVIDIRHLRAARAGFDPSFKTMIMELSQNIDRGGETAFGLCSCITPSGIFFISDRASPLTPHELLALQGIPINKVTFTVETDQQIQDLAGNAMSCTVIGIAQLSALIVAGSMLQSDSACLSDAQLLETEQRCRTERLCGVEHLRKAIEQGVSSSGNPDDLDFARLCAEAAESSRRCRCEGQTTLTRNRMFACDHCGHTVCSACRSRPLHNFRMTEIMKRMNPGEFELRWKPVFPVSIELDNLPDPTQFGLEDHSLTLKHWKRAEHWTVRYESATAILELVLTQQPEWKLYAKPPANLPANDPVRMQLEQPVARAWLSPDFLTSTTAADRKWSKNWKWFVPSKQKFEVQIESSQEMDPSWRAEYGLKGFEDEQIPKRLTVSAIKVPGDIKGIYEHLSNCGTACRSLYRRVSRSDKPESELEPLYLFLDPTRLGPVNQDAFVFARHHRQLEYDETRDVVVSLDAGWRPWRHAWEWDGDRADLSTSGFIPGTWMDSETSIRQREADLLVNSPAGNPAWNEPAYVDSCSDYLALLDARFHERGDTGKNRTYKLSDESGRAMFDSFSWVLEKIRHIPFLGDWRPLQTLSAGASRCQCCSPNTPSVQWRYEMIGKKAILIPQEEPTEASAFEKAIKSRPHIVDMAATVDEYSQECHLQAGINILSLAHRAHGRLVHGQSDSMPVTLSWNLTTEFAHERDLQLPPFRLTNNAQDAPHSQPEGFGLTLNPAQCRSLTWLRQQEHGVPFTVEEVEEEIVDSLRWKVEAKAETEVVVKGGVIADQVSYGKTIITLALIHSAFLNLQPSAPSVELPSTAAPTTFTGRNAGLLKSEATLIVVPNNITGQWRDQVDNCLPAHQYKPFVLVIDTPKILRDLKIKGILRAKIIIVPFSLFEKDEYAERLGQFAAMPQKPNGDGRAFTDWFKFSLGRFPQRLKDLKGQGVKLFNHNLPSQLEETLNDQRFQGQIPTQRLKGIKYKGFAEANGPKTIKSKPTKAKSTTKACAAQDDWEDFDFPVLHLFNFDRLVVDEFTYPKSMGYTSLINLAADKRWVLSGTPPLDDFADIKRIGAFLGINLGIDCDAYGVITRKNAKEILKEQTAFEQFQNFRQKRSSVWHERRHQHAQRFLDVFARQNFANLDVECAEFLRPVQLHLDHRALYKELNQHLAAREMRITHPSKYDCGDRLENFKASLHQQETAEEALLMRANFNPLSVSKSDQSACVEMIYRREADLDAVKKELEEQLLCAETLKRQCLSGETKYSEWRQRKLGEWTGDPKVAHDLRKMIANATEQVKDKPKMRHVSPAHAQEELRKLVSFKISTLERRFVALRRALRYARHLKKIHQEANEESTIVCEGCSSVAQAVGSAVFVGCGHVACEGCVSTSLSTGMCQVSGCSMSIDVNHILKTEDLASVEDLTVKGHRSFGQKLDAVLDLLEEIAQQPTLSEKDFGNKTHENSGGQAILFVQSYQMMKNVKLALNGRGISYYAIDRKGSASKDIQQFKTHVFDTDKHYRRVLLLNLGDESASGMDLVNANHVIFLSPLLTDTETKYHAAMTQAVGRCRRHGQKNAVHVYRFVALQTVDVDILEQRERLHPDNALQESGTDWRGVDLASPEYAEFERTRLVEDLEGGMALVPLSWVKESGRVEAERHGVHLGDGELRRFNSLVRFSDTFAEEAL
ncbi:uncharacterized protein K452DRAFT_138048 [Aplosporella prunicola CBS 121167]|uniref:Helicase C-terminal domain-containing protein n=1 Tax=Aplosporella prunicola CBS 121167 TaxID=1176127 RepID=A0A6A6AWK6_9PEZI|nr:uncharacterized protein K452DRAFT_138048 [Aplosporella prunicola CBS 121167]KAF2136382.1 hypothetical protein K452DRAFT_138048 [Aplosporella prunicola CBS 121167]